MTSIRVIIKALAGWSVNPPVVIAHALWLPPIQLFSACTRKASVWTPVLHGVTGPGWQFWKAGCLSRNVIREFCFNSTYKMSVKVKECKVNIVTLLIFQLIIIFRKCGRGLKGDVTSY